MSEPIQLELDTPFNIGPVNVFLFTDPEPVLVDCGMNLPETRDLLTQKLAEHQLTIADIKAVYITHAHVDHAGLAGWITENSDAHIYASAAASRWIINVQKNWQERVDFAKSVLLKCGLEPIFVNGFGPYMDQIPSMWDDVPADRFTEFPIDATLNFGGYEWRSIYAPGHTVTQTCFYQPQKKWLLSADMILHRSPLPVIEPPEVFVPSNRSFGLPQLLDSYKQFRELDISTVFPGHGDIIHDHVSLIDAQIERIDLRIGECFQLVKAGNSTAESVGKVMYAHYPPAGQVGAMGMVIGYLDVLIEQGKIVRQEVGGVWQHAPA